MILKSKGSSFVKHLIQAISSKTGYYLLPLRFSWKLCDPLKTLPLPPPVDPEINKFLISLFVSGERKSVAAAADSSASSEEKKP